MNIPKSPWFAAALASSTVYIPIARAQDALPSECSQRNLARVYENAYRRGERAVDKAARKLDDSCTQVEALQAELLDRLGQWIPQSGNGKGTPVCIAKGLTAGIYDALALLEMQCFGVCFMDGEFVGELAGTLYCELSLRFGGLGMPDMLSPPRSSPCGDRFEAACFETYTVTTQSYQDDRGRACSPYVAGAFEDVWLSTGREQCMYLDEDE